MPSVHCHQKLPQLRGVHSDKVKTGKGLKLLFFFLDPVRDPDNSEWGDMIAKFVCGVMEKR